MRSIEVLDSEKALPGRSLQERFLRGGERERESRSNNRGREPRQDT